MFKKLITYLLHILKPKMDDREERKKNVDIYFDLNSKEFAESDEFTDIVEQIIEETDDGIVGDRYFLSRMSNDKSCFKVSSRISKEEENLIDVHVFAVDIDMAVNDLIDEWKKRRKI